MGDRFIFSSELWEWTNDALSRVFVTLPTDFADKIDHMAPNSDGFRSVKVNAQIGTTKWSTSLFADKESGSFVLPIKRKVRDAEKIDVGTTAEITIKIVHATRPASHETGRRDSRY